MLGYLSPDIICSEKQTVFLKRSSRKTVSFEEQIMSKDKYPSLFSPQMEAIVFIILQIFYATRAVLKICWGIFGHVTCLDQSRASEKIWCIIISNYWMRLSRIWRILQIKEGVIHRGRRPRWITPSEICRILHILQKPNSIITLLFIQNIFP